jgi:hypothetical protein
MPHVGRLLQLRSGPAIAGARVAACVKVYDAGVNHADTHHVLSRALHQLLDAPPSLGAAEGAAHP